MRHIVWSRNHRNRLCTSIAEELDNRLRVFLSWLVCIRPDDDFTAGQRRPVRFRSAFAATWRCHAYVGQRQFLDRISCFFTLADNDRCTWLSAKPFEPIQGSGHRPGFPAPFRLAVFAVKEDQRSETFTAIGFLETADIAEQFPGIIAIDPSRRWLPKFWMPCWCFRGVGWHRKYASPLWFVVLLGWSCRATT